MLYCIGALTMGLLALYIYSHGRLSLVRWTAFFPAILAFADLRLSTTMPSIATTTDVVLYLVLRVGMFGACGIVLYGQQQYLKQRAARRRRAERQIAYATHGIIPMEAAAETADRVSEVA